MIIYYKIGRKYKYPKSNEKYVLKKVHNKIFIFECGHAVTDNVFLDLIDLEVNKPVWMLSSKQLDLFS
jgi:hypothetical protein